MLMLHCGGTPATLKDIGSVPLPLATETHRPIPHDLFVRIVLDEIEEAGMSVSAMSFALNRKGAQMFGVIQCDAVDEETSIAFGLRSSHDKSMSKGLCGGRTVFVCDNLMFDAQAFRVLRRHTRHILRDLSVLVQGSIAGTEAAQVQIGLDIGIMKETPISTTEGYGLLGRAYGSGLLTSVQTTRAFREWRKPTHETFESRDLWSLYNAGTEALKLGRPQGVIVRHTNWHRNVMSEA
jgi:hypothetical protein